MIPRIELIMAKIGFSPILMLTRLSKFSLMSSSKPDGLLMICDF